VSERLGTEVDIYHSARPGPVRIESRRLESQRLMISNDVWLGILVGLCCGCRVGNIGWLGKIGWLGVMLGLCCFGSSSRFGSSVPFIALMLTQQLQCLGGLGEDADGLGAAHIHRIGVALLGEDLGDSVDGGFEPDRIA